MSQLRSCSKDVYKQFVFICAYECFNVRVMILCSGKSYNAKLSLFSWIMDSIRATLLRSFNKCVATLSDRGIELLFSAKRRQLATRDSTISILSKDVALPSVRSASVPASTAISLGQCLCLVNHNILFVHFLRGCRLHDLSERFIDLLSYFLALSSFDSPDGFFYSSIGINLEFQSFDASDVTVRRTSSTKFSISESG